MSGNDRGVPETRIGSGIQIGVSPPQDHPHIYMDVAAADTILCPYCGMRFPFRPAMETVRCRPAGQFLC
jgi:hypothetical protein